MLKRTVSGIIGASLVLLALGFNKSLPFLLNVLLALVCVISMNEIFSVTGMSKKYGLVIPTYIFNFLLPMFAIYEAIVFAWYLYTLTLFLVMLIFKTDISFKDVAISYTVSIAITLSFTILLIVRDSDINNGLFFVVLTLAIAWMADTGAYFCGSFFGKHKLCPLISPKKTVEGAVAGIIISILSTLAVCWIFENYIFTNGAHINYLYISIVAFIGSIISIIGDLSFSFIKRGFNVKDFGNVIPGHGGILDRVDSVIFIPPFLFMINMIFPIIQ